MLGTDPISALERKRVATGNLGGSDGLLGGGPVRPIMHSVQRAFAHESLDDGSTYAAASPGQWLRSRWHGTP